MKKHSIKNLTTLNKTISQWNYYTNTKAQVPRRRVPD